MTRTLGHARRRKLNTLIILRNKELPRILANSQNRSFLNYLLLFDNQYNSRALIFCNSSLDMIYEIWKNGGLFNRGWPEIMNFSNVSDDMKIIIIRR